MMLFDTGLIFTQVFESVLAIHIVMGAGSIGARETDVGRGKNRSGQ